MRRYRLARLKMKAVIVSLCPLFAIVIPSLWAVAQRAPVPITTASSNLSGAVLIGKPAPQFVAVTLDGKQVSLADYKGNALIVNFWATWCAACKEEMPWLAQLREQYAGQRFEILGIVTDGASDEKIRQIADKYGVKYPILRCNHRTAQAFGGLPYLPESFYIAKDGRVLIESADAGSKDEIEADIRKTLGLKTK